MLSRITGDVSIRLGNRLTLRYGLCYCHNNPQLTQLFHDRQNNQLRYRLT